MISLDDLVTDWWLKGSPYGGWRGNNLTDLSTHHMTITHFPMSPELKLDSPYTIFRPEFPISTNILVKKKIGIADWKGDILIVKHAYNDLSLIINMDEEDKNLVDLIVTEYIAEAGHDVKRAECS